MAVFTLLKLSRRFLWSYAMLETWHKSSPFRFLKRINKAELKSSALSYVSMKYQMTYLIT
ncbi:MAG: hypothetical protein EHM58_00375 [Ignavibacteriae bacterium]|nr:MAG: hypothetical protein EHM58_00375 [Ignavibacteriota bacterium]